MTADRAPGSARTGRGRRPGGEDTRGRIIAAAREAFGERGFDATSVREVATRAGVDAALVHHYFGTKQRLFVAAMEFPVDPTTVLPGLLGDGGPGTGERFVRFVVALWDRPEVRPMLLGVVRSASTDAVAAAMTRRLVAEGPIAALAARSPLPDAEVRAALAGAHLVGIVLARYIIALEPIASMTPDELATRVGPVIERYLFAA